MRLNKYLTEAGEKPIAIFIGRMSPPTIAHQKIIEDAVRKYSTVYIFIVEGEKSSQLSKNFLTFAQRKEILKITNPKAEPILSRIGYIPDIIEKEKIDTSNGVVVIAGSDRIDGYRRQFKGVSYPVIFDEIKRTDEDVSASKVRQSLADKDFSSYRRMVAKGLDNEKWFNTFRELMAKRGNEIKEGFTYDFLDILNEEVNKHIEHFEDNMFNRGVEGIKQNLDVAKSILSTLSGNSKGSVKLSVKWDGAPAIFFGRLPETGKFFVSTKSIFNKTPKIATSLDEIDKNFSGGVVEKLRYVFPLLKDLNVDTIYQGDLLFTNDKKTESINGVSYITFTPNTITYAIPNDDSDLASAIRKAKMGIVVHTEYKGQSLDSLSANFNVNIDRYKNNPDVWIQDAFIEDESGIVNFSMSEVSMISKWIEDIEKRVKYVNDELFEKMKDIGIYNYFRTFVNKNVREGRPIEVPSKYLEDFKNYLQDVYSADILKVKRSETQEKKAREMESLQMFLTKYQRDIMFFFWIYRVFVRMKTMFVEKLSQIKSVGTFIRSGDEYKVTNPEGFCAIDSSGNVLKLVDRLEFSRSNFTLEKNWK